MRGPAPAHRSTSRTLLKLGLAAVCLDAISVGLFIRAANADRASASALLFGLTTGALTFVATSCLVWSFVLWADARWKILTKWVWPRSASKTNPLPARKR